MHSCRLVLGKGIRASGVVSMSTDAREGGDGLGVGIVVVAQEMGYMYPMASAKLSEIYTNYIYTCCLCSPIVVPSDIGVWNLSWCGKYNRPRPPRSGSEVLAHFILSRGIWHFTEDYGAGSLSAKS